MYRLNYKRFHVPTGKAWRCTTHFNNAQEAMRQLMLWNGGQTFFGMPGVGNWLYIPCSIEPVRPDAESDKYSYPTIKEEAIQ